MASIETVQRVKREPFLSAPNLVSLSRIPMGALVWLRPLDPFYVLGLMALAAASDVLDGWLERHLRARRGDPRGSGHTIGMWLDPLCDKIFILSVLAAVIVARRPALFMLPLIASREIIQTAAALGWEFIPRLREHLALRFQASLIGKAATTGQFFTIGAVLMRYPAQVPLAFLTGALGLAAGLSYVARAWRKSCAC
jgi:phosphatidylglycerophosphate synthase